MTEAGGDCLLGFVLSLGSGPGHSSVATREQGELPQKTWKDQTPRGLWLENRVRCSLPGPAEGLARAVLWPELAGAEVKRVGER